MIFSVPDLPGPSLSSGLEWHFVTCSYIPPNFLCDEGKRHYVLFRMLDSRQNPGTK